MKILVVEDEKRLAALLAKGGWEFFILVRYYLLTMNLNFLILPAT